MPDCLNIDSSKFLSLRINFNAFYLIKSKIVTKMLHVQVECATLLMRRVNTFVNTDTYLLFSASVSRYVLCIQGQKL